MVVEILEEKLDREYIDYAADLVWQNLGESAVGGSTESTTNGEEDDMEDMETDGETAEGSGAVQSLSKEPSLVALPTHWDPMDDPSVSNFVPFTVLLSPQPQLIYGNRWPFHAWINMSA